MYKFDSNSSLIRSRINDNLLKVSDESSDVKSLLSLSVQSANTERSRCTPTSAIEVLNDINLHSRSTSRHDLLRTAIILATSRNTQAQENLIEVIRFRIGKVKDKDYKFIADLISLKNPKIVERVNDFLSYYLQGFEDMHKKYYKQYYGF